MKVFTRLRGWKVSTPLALGSFAACVSDGGSTSSLIDRGSCDVLIECAASLAPEVRDEYEQTYGAGGVCWQSGPNAWAGCRDFCSTTLDSLNLAAMATGDSCGTCTVDANCGEFGAGATCENGFCAGGSGSNADEDSGEGEGDGDGESEGDGDGDGGMEATYLFALEMNLGPDLPLQFVATFDLTPTPDGGAIANVSLQPLSLGQGQTTSPREFIGPPFEYSDIVIDADGSYEIDMGSVMISGEANPVTGSDLVATFLVDGVVVDADAMCGEVDGQMTIPLEFDLGGSTYAAVRLADDGSNPATLPVEFPYRCDMLGN